jgi:membrane protein
MSMSEHSLQATRLKRHEPAPGVLARRIWKGIRQHEILTRAAAVTYYALTALVPFLALVVTLGAHLAPDIAGPSGTHAPLGDMTVDEFREALSRLLPQEAYHLVAIEIARIQQQPPVGFLSLGLVLSLWFASGVSWALMDALNRIHEVEETRSYPRLALISLGLTMLQTIIVLGTLSAMVIWPQVSTALGWRYESSLLNHAGQLLILSLASLLSLEVLLHFGPNVRRPWRCASPGSIMATMAFLVTSLLLRQYVRYFGNYGRWYGSLAGVMLLMFWIWINTVVLLVAVLVNMVVEGALGCDRSNQPGTNGNSAMQPESTSGSPM